MTRRAFPRALAAALILTLARPAPSVALRTQAGLESPDTERALTATLTGLEEETWQPLPTADLAAVLMEFPRVKDPQGAIQFVWYVDEPAQQVLLGSHSLFYVQPGEPGQGRWVGFGELTGWSSHLHRAPFVRDRWLAELDGALWTVHHELFLPALEPPQQQLELFSSVAETRQKQLLLNHETSSWWNAWAPHRPSRHADWAPEANRLAGRWNAVARQTWHSLYPNPTTSPSALPAGVTPSTAPNFAIQVTMITHALTRSVQLSVTPSTPPPVSPATGLEERPLDYAQGTPLTDAAAMSALKRGDYVGMQFRRGPAYFQVVSWFQGVGDPSARITLRLITAHRRFASDIGPRWLPEALLPYAPRQVGHSERIKRGPAGIARVEDAWALVELIGRTYSSALQSQATSRLDRVGSRSREQRAWGDALIALAHAVARQYRAVEPALQAWWDGLHAIGLLADVVKTSPSLSHPVENWVRPEMEAVLAGIGARTGLEERVRITADTPLVHLAVAATALTDPQGRDYDVDYVNLERGQVLIKPRAQDDPERIWKPLSELVGWSYEPAAVEADAEAAVNDVSLALSRFRNSTTRATADDPSLISSLEEATVAWLDTLANMEATALAAKWNALADAAWLQLAPDDETDPSVEWRGGDVEEFARLAWQITQALTRYATLAPTGLEEPTVVSPAAPVVKEDAARQQAFKAAAVAALDQVAQWVKTHDADLPPPRSSVHYVLKDGGLAAAPAFAAAGFQDFVALVEEESQAIALTALGVPAARIAQGVAITDIPNLAPSPQIIQIIDTAAGAQEVVALLHHTARRLPAPLVPLLTTAIQRTDDYLAAIGV